MSNATPRRLPGRGSIGALFNAGWSRADASSRASAVPLHEKQFTFIDPQQSSPLYNGRIPAELRIAIFDHCLAEYYQELDSTTIPHPNTLQYPKNTNYTRPGYEGKKTINRAFLQSCRRVYLETYHLPYIKKEHLFWHARGPQNHPGSTLAHFGEQEHLYFESFLPWQRALIKEIHLFAQSFWLEDTFPRLVKSNFMQNFERVKITIRRGDWWWNERNEILGISPRSGRGDGQQMLNEWAIERAGGHIPWNKEGWGYAFKLLKNLKVIELELETSDDKKDELKAIVEHAKGWTFPAFAQDGATEMLFKSDDHEPVWSKWDGPPCFWSEVCPYCGQARKCATVDPPNEGCIDKMEREKNQMGPLCHVANLRWKLGKKE